MMHKEVALKKDRIFLLYLFLLVVFGVVVLGSATLPIGFERYNDPYHFVRRHVLLGVLPGLFLFFVASKIPCDFWRRTYVLWGVCTLVLLSLVFIPLLKAPFGTSQSWIQIGAFSMQPAEFAKVTCILALAGFFANKDLATRRSFIKTFLPFVVFMLSIVFLMMMQPDVGTLLVLSTICLTIFFVAGMRFSHMALLILTSISGLVTATLSVPYRMARVETFLNPGADIQGAGYQLHQSLIAIGSGGLFGLGLGHSRQKFLYVPEISSDSIFAIISEELGFIAVVLFLVLVALFFLRGIRIGLGAVDLFQKLVVIGVMIWYCSQTIINIGSVVGLLPFTGVPLPFISHGGSATVALFIVMGIVAGISKKPRLVRRE